MIWFIFIVILLAAIDAWRMKRVWGKVKNINHWLSYLLCIIGITGLWLAINGWAICWAAIYFVLECVALRGMFYDFCLNVFVNFFVNPRAIDYISANSNSLSEDRLTKIPFWWRRVLFTLLFAATIVIKIYIH